MPIIENAKTVWVDEEYYNIPGTEINIWKIKLEVDGERELHSTMSKALATMGWSGDVEVYTNAKGKDYVRQAPKEESHGGVASSPKTESYEPGTVSRWAIGMAYRAFVQVTGSIEDSTGEFPFDAVKEHATHLVRMFNDIKFESQARSNLDDIGQERPQDNL